MTIPTHTIPITTPQWARTVAGGQTYQRMGDILGVVVDEVDDETMIAAATLPKQMASNMNSELKQQVARLVTPEEWAEVERTASTSLHSDGSSGWLGKPGTVHVHRSADTGQFYFKHDSLKPPEAVLWGPLTTLQAIFVIGGWCGPIDADGSYTHRTWSDDVWAWYNPRLWGDISEHVAALVFPPDAHRIPAQ